MSVEREYQGDWTPRLHPAHAKPTREAIDALGHTHPIVNAALSMHVKMNLPYEQALIMMVLALVATNEKQQERIVKLLQEKAK